MPFSQNILEGGRKSTTLGFNECILRNVALTHAAIWFIDKAQQMIGLGQ